MSNPHSAPDVNILKSLTPLNSLREDQLVILAGQSKVEYLPTGEVLIERGSMDPKEIYLLEGRVEMKAADGRKRILEGGTEKASRPLARLRPCMYGVKALSAVKYLQVDMGDLNPMEQRSNPDIDGLVVVEAPHPEVEENQEDRLYRLINCDLTNDTLAIPSLPEVALRIQRTIEKDVDSSQFIGRIVESDPAITAKLIKAANSPVYRGKDPVVTCTNAIVRLGLHTTKQLVVSFAMRELFASDSPHLKKRMQELWSHCTEVAAISFVLARLTEGLDPERAMIAGLVHDIGVISLFSYAGTEQALLEDETAFDKMVHRFRSELGGLILKKWDFHPDLVTAAEHADDWYRQDGVKADYCDLVLVAQLHYYVGKSGRNELPNMDQVPAFKKLAGGQLEPKLSIEILNQAKDQPECVRLRLKAQ